MFKGLVVMVGVRVKVKGMHYVCEGLYKDRNTRICVYCDCNFPFQLKAKRSECNSKATHARNEYLLTLAAANAHQRHYYDTDLISCIKVRTWTLDVREWTLDARTGTLD